MTESTWSLTVHKDASSFPIGAQRERVVLLIDCSRSMLQTDYPPSRLAAAKQGAMEFVNKKVGLDPGDEVAVAYFGKVARAAAGVRRVGGNEEYFQNRINRLRVSYWAVKLAAAWMVAVPVVLDCTPTVHSPVAPVPAEQSSLVMTLLAPEELVRV